MMMSTIRPSQIFHTPEILISTTIT